MIDRDTVRYIANLARLRLAETEIESLTVQLAAVLDYIEQLDRVDTSDVEPTCFIAVDHDPLRADTVEPSLPPDQALRNGPSVRKGHFAIPKVIG